MTKDLNEKEVKKISTDVLFELGNLRQSFIKEETKTLTRLDCIINPDSINILNLFELPDNLRYPTRETINEIHTTGISISQYYKCNPRTKDELEISFHYVLESVKRKLDYNYNYSTNKYILNLIGNYSIGDVEFFKTQCDMFLSYFKLERKDKFLNDIKSLILSLYNYYRIDWKDDIIFDIYIRYFKSSNYVDRENIFNDMFKLNKELAIIIIIFLIDSFNDFEEGMSCL